MSLKVAQQLLHRTGPEPANTRPFLGQVDPNSAGQCGPDPDMNLLYTLSKFGEDWVSDVHVIHSQREPPRKVLPRLLETLKSQGSFL